MAALKTGDQLVVDLLRFCRVRRGMGVDGELVSDLEKLKRQVAVVLTGFGPAMLDVPLNREANAGTYPAFAPYGADT